MVAVSVGRADSTPPLDVPFLAVLIDVKTERTIGKFPYDRAVLAKAVEKAADSGAKAVVLKFFLDQRKTPSGDTALAQAMRKVNVVLEARIDNSKVHPNTLPARFAVRPSGNGNVVGGTSGWIPIPQFSEHAKAIGFVDTVSADRIPVIERYGERYVPALCTRICQNRKASRQ